MRFGHGIVLFAISVALVSGQSLLPPDHPTVSTSRLDFGVQYVGAANSRQTVTLSYPQEPYFPQSSSDFIDIIAISLSDSTNFSISGGTCPLVSTDGYIPDGYHLGRWQSCTIEIEYRPSSSGLNGASLEIYSNQGRIDPYTWTPWPGLYIPKSRWVITPVYLKGSAQPAKAVPGDFDGDGKRDYTVWRPSNGMWYAFQSSNEQMLTQQWGLLGDIPVSGDFDGDGRADVAVWRPSSGIWYILQSSNGQLKFQQWGLLGDVPLSGDFDGDGRADYAVWRPSNGTWYVIRSSDGQVVIQQWGVPDDIPICGDFDRDGKTDYAVWRPSNGIWYVLNSSDGQFQLQQWGLAGDVPLSGDFDGDGQTDYVVWRPANGTWYVIPSSDTLHPFAQQWGVLGDIPITGDFDGDGRTDFAVYRPATGMWYVIPSTATEPFRMRQWGVPGDSPL